MNSDIVPLKNSLATPTPILFPVGGWFLGVGVSLPPFGFPEIHPARVPRVWYVLEYRNGEPPTNVPVLRMSFQPQYVKTLFPL